MGGWASIKAVGRRLRAALPPYPKDRVAAALGVFALLILIAAFVWSLGFSDIDESIPDYALGSELVFRLERAVAAAALLLIPALALAPLLAGRLPRSIGSGGIDWDEDRGNVVRTLQGHEARIRALQDSVDSLLEALEDKR